MTQPLDTRDHFLTAAAGLFARHGYDGASLANIGDALGLTKQALIHHFGTKDALYDAVLSRVSDRIVTALEAAQSTPLDPRQKVEVFFAGFCAYALETPDDMRLILRELLDNRHDPAGDAWRFGPFLRDLATMLRQTEAWQGASEATALVAVHQTLGAILVFATSGPGLSQMFGPQLARNTRTAYPDALARQVSALLDRGP